MLLWGGMIIVFLFINLVPLTPTVSAEQSPRATIVTGTTFTQLDFYLDGVPTLDSDWGSINVSFYGSANIQYLNLESMGIWSIQNIPVLSLEGDGIEQTQSFWFPLNVPTGTQVTTITYGYALTPTVLSIPPVEDKSAPVSDDEYVVYNGGEDVVLHTIPPAAAPVVGAAVADPKQHKKKNVPNQDAGENECAPTAVSNSMQFLNDEHKLGMDPSELTIEKMKVATKWKVPPRTKACYIWHDDTRPEGHRNAWWEDKDAYMKAKKLPITTKRVMPNDISKIADEIDACQDIEAELNGHTVTVVGIADLGGGKYSVTVKHDKKQGPAGNGGLTTETGIWDSNTGKWSGALTGYGLNYFVVECPEKPVGGIFIPVDKFGLLAPYIALASTILVATATTAIYVKRVKRTERRKEKQ
jgi:hypothetical protein